jgi:hypothetical protein
LRLVSRAAAPQAALIELAAAMQPFNLYPACLRRIDLAVMLRRDLNAWM